MMPSEYTELMNMEIDGTNTAADSQRLQEYLAECPEAADRFQELRQAVEVFDELPSLDPPANLRQRILDAVDALSDPGSTTQAVPSGTRSSWLYAFWRDLRHQPRYRLAFTTGFAISLLLAAVAWQLTAHIGPIVPGDLRGALVRQVEFDRGSRGNTVVVDAGGVATTVQFNRAGSRILVQIALTSDRPATVRLLSDGPIACESFRAMPPARIELTATGQWITLTLPGAGEYEIVLHHPDEITPDIKFQVLDDHNVLFEQPIVWGRN